MGEKTTPTPPYTHTPIPQLCYRIWYQQEPYAEAKAELLKLHQELVVLNRSAANSLVEGLEETLTLRRLGIFAELGKSLKTTNGIENLNSRLGKYLGRVKYWQTLDQQLRSFDFFTKLEITLLKRVG